VVSSSSWAAHRIEELLYYQETHSVFSAGNGEVELYEFVIQDEWAGFTLADLVPDKECVLAALTRGGRAMLPAPDEILKKNDLILVSASLKGSETLRNRLRIGPKRSAESE
jgi:Trk K+ transport system NAD-binding subunit